MWKGAGLGLPVSLLNFLFPFWRFIFIVTSNRRIIYFSSLFGYVFIFLYFLANEFCLIFLIWCFGAPVGKSVNQPGLTGSSGVSEPRLLPPAQTPVLGSAAPFQAWPVGPKWHSTITEATWSIQSATINLSPPSLPCRWDLDPEVVLKVPAAPLLGLH